MRASGPSVSSFWPAETSRSTSGGGSVLIRCASSAAAAWIASGPGRSPGTGGWDSIRTRVLDATDEAATPWLPIDSAPAQRLFQRYGAPEYYESVSFADGGYLDNKPFEQIYRHHRRYRITEGAEEIQMRRVAGYMFGFMRHDKGD